MATKKIDVEIGAKNKLAAGLKSGMASIKRFGRGVKYSLNAVGLSFKRVAMIGVGSFAAMIKHGNAFRASMAEVKTMLGDDKTMLPELTNQVRALSAEFGLAKDTLAGGLYNALSAGVPAGNAIDFLRVASKAAVGGVTDVDTAVDGLTTVLNAYGIEASKIGQVSDIMFTVVKEGKITFEELAQNIGQVAPFAKVAGVGIEDLSAMIATLVKVDKPERAMTSLRQAMTYAAEQGKPLLQILDEFEGKSLAELLAAGVSQKSAAGIAVMSGNIAVLRKELKIFENTAGSVDEAFADVSEVGSWKRLWQSFLSIVSKIGETIDRHIGPAIDRAGAAIRRFGKSERFGQFIERVKDATDLVDKLLDSLSQGGDQGKRIGKALSLAISIAGQKFVDLLMLAAPVIGKLIGTAAKIAIGSVTTELDFEKAEKQLVSEGAIERKFGRRSIFGKVFGTSEEDKEKIENRIYENKIAEITKGSSGAGAKINQIFKDLEQQSETSANAPSVKPDIMPKIGIGNAPSVSGGMRSISASTSMLSTGDLFSMMQTGTGYKRDSELSELQGINQGIQDLIEVSGGVE
jgi:hypothetical protein